MTRFRNTGEPPGWLARDVGATLVEYSLFLALFVVVSIGALQFLSSEGEEATMVQIDCVEQRPPSASCQIPAIVTSTSDSVPITTTTAPPLPDPESTVNFGDTSATPLIPADSGWEVTAEFDLQDDELNAVEGGIIQVSITIPGFPSAIPAQCVTDSFGSCTLTVNLPEVPGASQATITVISVISDPTVTSYPTPQTVALP